MKIISFPSPNFSTRASPVNMLIIHYTNMLSAELALDLLCNPEKKVSAHYLISKEGQVYNLVPEDLKAYHAGVSFWKGEENLNNCSIGIELDNDGHQYGPSPYPDVQINALIELINDIRGRHSISNDRILGHSDIASSRKTDPGEHFPWQKLAKHGIGLWPFKTNKVVHSSIDIKQVQVLLSEIGYKILYSSQIDLQTFMVIKVFQQHFDPSSLTAFDISLLKKIDTHEKEQILDIPRTLQEIMPYSTFFKLKAVHALFTTNDPSLKCRI